MKWLDGLRANMGQLLGPEPAAEIVITYFPNDGNKINFQIIGMHGPVPPQQVLQLLETVAKQMVQQVPPPQVEEAPTV